MSCSRHSTFKVWSVLLVPPSNSRRIRIPINGQLGSADDASQIDTEANGSGRSTAMHSADPGRLIERAR